MARIRLSILALVSCACGKHAEPFVCPIEPEPAVLLSGVSSIALDESFAYWSHAGPSGALISRVPKSGGAVQDILSGDPNCTFRATVVDATSVFAVYHCGFPGGPQSLISGSKTGGPLTTLLVDKTGGLEQLAIGPDNVGFGEVSKYGFVSKSGGPADEFPIGGINQFVTGVVADGNRFLWFGGGPGGHGFAPQWAIGVVGADPPFLQVPDPVAALVPTPDAFWLLLIGSPDARITSRLRRGGTGASFTVGPSAQSLQVSSTSVLRDPGRAAVYWIEGGGIQRSALDGSQRCPFSSMGGFTELHLDGSGLYAVAATILYRFQP